MVLPEPLTFEADDKYPVKGFCWRHLEAGLEPTPLIIINPATSVLCRYYFRFAVFLFEHGFDVIACDYRGFDAGWIDWGHRDFEAVLDDSNA
jgi:predicted alpha/beta hydrolase